MCACCGCYSADFDIGTKIAEETLALLSVVNLGSNFFLWPRPTCIAVDGCCETANGWMQMEGNIEENAQLLHGSLYNGTPKLQNQNPPNNAVHPWNIA